MPVSQPPRHTADENPTEQADLFGWVERLRANYGRFSWDFGGVILIAFSLMWLLALMGLTDGVLLTALSELLKRWMGWGSYLLVVALSAIGLFLLRRSAQPLVLRWGQVIGYELSAFFALMFLSIIGSPLGSLLRDFRTPLERAEMGLDGGRIGWGLSQFVTILFGPVIGGLLVFIGLAVSVIAAFNLFPHIERWILKRAGELPEVFPTSQAAALTPNETEPVIHPMPETRAERPQTRPEKVIPPEFRKSFKVPEQQDKLPEKPLERSPNLPPFNILFAEQGTRPDERSINQTAGLIEKTLSEFGIPAQVVGFRTGPTITQFAVQPGFIKKPGSNEDDPQLMKVRVAQIASLEKDLALALSAERLRIEAPVPGRSYVGIEVPNQRTSMVRLRPLLESDAFAKIGAPLAVALGRDVSGQPLLADLARMPHLLVAGSTGSGKSVFITALAACLAMNNSPADLRIVMVDAKMVELIRFNGLPHLYGKVETDVNRIIGVLRWVVVEMEHRYRLLEAVRVRDLQAYNQRAMTRKDGSLPLPRIVVIIDELADLMMSAPDQTEHSLVRLAQMARATGIHLVVATQRPSTDVVTGLIKANFPARLAFSVASGVDSRVILDMPGAENLLGRGDMLFLNPEVGNPIRAQGVYVSDQEIERIIAFWQKVSPHDQVAAPWEALLLEPDDEGDDSLVEQAVEIVRRSQRASASLLQRRLRIGYPRAARLLDQLEAMGVVGPSTGGGREREVLIDPQEDDEPFDGE